MEYITEEPRPGCLFCRLRDEPDDEDSRLVVARSESALVILNKFPYNPGHCLVAPAVHKAALEELTDEEMAGFMREVQRTIRVLKTSLTPDGLNVGANLGRAAGAGIPDHVHLHVVPRWNGDTNFMPVLDDVKMINEHLLVTVEKLKKAFAAS
jgi:ATP adenylyltransferase